MTEQEALEGNILIAKFMGMKKEVQFTSFNVWNNGVSGFHDNDLKYHTSWDWLMPVIHKIENTEFEDGDWAYLRTFSNETGVRFNRFALYKSETRIQSAWLAVVNFIKWYNNEKKNN